ncbi:hypothetical protein GSB9_02072 [Flavobacteriaceae bacterium GSB9]|nr:hypothetical protein GSB9_02072 [Flavobacteriaceae bacterium GSB9]
MKTILFILLIALTTSVCNASNPITPSETSTTTIDKQIPEDVKAWLKAELANTTTTVLENFETPAFFTKKNAKIIGYIKGYDQTLGAKTGIFYYTNQLTRENKPRVLEIHEDGRFELELPLDYPMQNYFVIEKYPISFYIEPGQNLSIILNWEDLKAKRTSRYFKKARYQGPLKKINTDLLHYKPEYNSGHFQEKEAVMQPDAFKKYMLEFKTNALNEIKAYEQSGEIDKKTSELLTNDIVLETYRFLFDYYLPTHSPRYGQGKRKANNIDDTHPEDYYDFIPKLPLHKQSILVNQNFGVFINRLEYADPLQPQSKNMSVSTSISSDDFLKFLETKNVKISLKEKELYKTFQKELSNWVKQNGHKKPELPKDLTNKIRALNKKYEPFRKEYYNFIEERRENAWKKYFIKKWQEQDSIASSLGIKNNLVYEIIKTRTLKFMMESDGMYKDKAWYWSELKKGITSPYLIQVCDNLFNDKVSEPETYPLPEHEPGTAIFNKLIAPYKGKIVVIEFWNPHSYYQGKDLEDIKKRRKLYENNKDVVFLNITNESRSTPEYYKSAVEKNGFKNSLRIPQDDYNYMRQLFKFNASAHDVLVKKDGETVYNNFEAHNVEHFLRQEFNIEPTQQNKNSVYIYH